MEPPFRRSERLSIAAIMPRPAAEPPGASSPLSGRLLEEKMKTQLVRMISLASLAGALLVSASAWAGGPQPEPPTNRLPGLVRPVVRPIINPRGGGPQPEPPTKGL